MSETTTGTAQHKDAPQNCEREPRVLLQLPRDTRRRLFEAPEWYSQTSHSGKSPATLFGVTPTTLVRSSAGPQDTADLAAAIAPELRAGDVVLLVGELGTGKSTFVRAAASTLGVTEYVTSPTFSVAQRYESGTLPIAHLDAYRLVDPDDEDFELTLDMIGEDAVAFVEWPDALADRLPEARLTIALEHRGGDARLVAFTTSDPRLLEPLRQLVDDPRA